MQLIRDISNYQFFLGSWLVFKFLLAVIRTFDGLLDFRSLTFSAEFYRQNCSQHVSLW